VKDADARPENPYIPTSTGKYGQNCSPRLQGDLIVISLLPTGLGVDPPSLKSDANAGGDRVYSSELEAA
jgi:hypothetical protein